MEVTKKNVDLVALQLLQEVQQLIGRLVGTASNDEKDPAHRWTFRLKIATTTYDRSSCL